MRVFISYSHEEEPLGKRVKELVERWVPDATAFLSSVDLALGTRWLDELEQQLRAATHVILICSPESVDRPWLNFEAGAALTSDVDVIPVCHSGLTFADLPDRFGRYQGIDLVDPIAVARLLTSLGAPATDLDANAAWREVDSAIARISYAPVRPKLDAPPDPTSAILIDQWHGQDWECPILAPGDVEDLRRAEPRWTFHPVTRAPGQPDLYPSLDGWRSMIMATPHRGRFSSSTIDHLVTWVRRGARIAVFGYELGERHHDANLNALLGPFGVRLNTDIVAPAAWPDRGGKPYGERVLFTDLDPKSPLTSGLGSLAWTNTQTLILEPGGVELVRLGDNRVGRLRSAAQEGPDVDAVHYGYTSTGVFQVGNQQFDFFDIPSAVVAGLAPADLTGRGGVLVVGTWDVLPRGPHAHSPDNVSFVLNVLRWLTGTSGGI